MIDVEHVRAFLHVVECGSFSEAARALDTTQPTVSKRLAALEEELGVSLVERTTRTLRVTEAGKAYAREVAPALAAVEEAADRVRCRAPVVGGRLRVSLPVVFGQLHIVPWLPIFARAFPDVELQLRFTDRYVDLLADEVDVCLRVGVAIDSSLRSRRLGLTERWVVASPAYVQEHRAVRRPADLAKHECLLHPGAQAEQRLGGTWRFSRSGQTSRVRVRGRLSADNSQALRELARAGLGVALLATWLVRDDVEDGRLVRLLPSWRAPSAPIQALFPPGRFVPARTRAFLDHLSAHLDLD